MMDTQLPAPMLWEEEEGKSAHLGFWPCICASWSGSCPENYILKA